VTTQVAAGVNLVDGDGIQGRRDLFDRTLGAGEVLLECGNIFESPAIVSFGIDGSEPTLLHEMAITVRNNDGMDNAEISWDYIIFSSDPLDCFTEDVPLTRLPCDATEDSEVSCADGIDTDCDGLADDADPDCGPVGTVFRRGDCDQSGKADFNDAIFHLRFLFLGDNTEVVEGCPDACDSDDSGDDDFTDDINLLKFLFLGQGTIPDPGPLPDESHPCGLDPTLEDPEELTCDTYLPTIACP
jgi:hypothetical protein